MAGAPSEDLIGGGLGRRNAREDSANTNQGEKRRSSGRSPDSVVMVEVARRDVLAAETAPSLNFRAGLAGLREEIAG